MKSQLEKASIFYFQAYYKNQQLSMKEREQDVSIFLCTFEVKVHKANVLIKFPCQYFLEWKTSNGKKIVEGIERPTANNTIVEFNETLQMSSEMIFDNNAGKFFKKETVLNLNLISKSRQDQVKLIGRVTIDLAELANRQQSQQQRTHKLAYCSVDAELTFSANMKSKQLTNLGQQDLDRSSFNDYFSFYSCGSKQAKPKKEATTQCQDTSIRNPHENVIDITNPLQIHPKNFSQTFFMMPTKPIRMNGQKSLYTNIKEVEQGHHHNRSTSRQSNKITPITNPIPNPLAKREQHQWENQTFRFRGQIDGNREKIQQLERKIMDLCANLEDSKRNLEFTENQNRQKENIIKKLKQSVERDNVEKDQKHSERQINSYSKEISGLHERLERMARENQEKQTRWKHQEDNYKDNTTALRRETDQLRRIWNQKKELYQDKLKQSEEYLKKKDQQVVQLGHKIEESLKYKYQYEMVKQMCEEKEEKIKIAEKALAKMNFDLQEIKRNNLAEQLYKLKVQNAQITKNYEQLLSKTSKFEQEISKYRQNYIKIETAYQIQSKNYDNSKEKINQNELNIYSLQKENIQLKNTIKNLEKVYQQLEQKLSGRQQSLTLLQKSFEDQRDYLNTSMSKLETALKDKEELQSLSRRLKLELQVKSSQFQQKIKKIEQTIICGIEQKEKAFIKQKQLFESQLYSYKTSKVQLQLIIQQNQDKLRKLQQENLVERQNKDIQMKSLEQAIKDKQQIIRLMQQELKIAKEENLSFIECLNKMKEKEKHLEDNIVMLELQSQKILYILEQKEQTDLQLDSLKQQYQLLSQKLKQSEQLVEGNANKLKAHEQTISNQREQLSNNQRYIQGHMHDIDIAKEQIKIANNDIARLQYSIRQINDRYEEYMKAQEKYQQEINLIRQEKEEMEMIINKNSNEFAAHDQEQINRISQIQQEMEALEHQSSQLDEEKRHLHSRLQELEYQLRENTIKYEQLINKSEALQNQCQRLTKELAQKIQGIKNLENTIQKHQILISKSQKIQNSLQQQINIKKQQFSMVLSQLNKKQQQLLILEKEKHQLFSQNEELKNGIIKLSVDDSPELLNNKHYLDDEHHNYNEPIRTAFTCSIIEESPMISLKMYEQLQENLLESDRKNQAFQQRISDLTTQLELLNHQQIKNSPPQESFHQFHRREMTKIIEQQRQQIQHLEEQAKENSGKDSAVLQLRIKQLQTVLVDLETNFKQQVNRIINEQEHRQPLDGLTVINQEMSQQDCYRSQRSIGSLVNSPSRMKNTTQLTEITQIKEKLNLVQQEKSNLEKLVETIQEEKFSLMSTINEKDIQLQQILRAKLILDAELQELKLAKDELSKKSKSLQKEVQNLKCQVNFGSSIVFPNERSVTHSEPIHSEENLRNFQNKCFQIQQLRSELEKQKAREQQLLWNIKDLEMQLQIVTQNLNALNASSANSVLHSHQLIHDQEGEPDLVDKDVSSKEKLLQSLKKNEELKTLSYSIIHSLKQRQRDAKEQERLIKAISESRSMISNSIDCFNTHTTVLLDKKIQNLITEFQNIKTGILRSKMQRQNEDNQKDNLIVKVISFEQRLREIKCLSESNELPQIR